MPMNSTSMVTPNRTCTLAASTVRLICVLLIAFGISAKFYDLNAPWKTHDHYNYGGVWTTVYAECLKRVPLEISKGVPSYNCRNNGELTFYRNHPSTILFALWGWTSFFGSEEWAYRLFILTFSSVNVLLIGSIARQVRPKSEVFPWLAAALQASFLGGLYFGTHLDFIGEFTVTFVLLTAYLALRGAITAACISALAAGVSAWPGYLVFGPLWIFTLATKRSHKKVLIFGVIGLGLALATMAWLQQTTDLLSFLQRKLLKPGYVKADRKGWLEPVFFLKNFITSQSRLLSPFFACIAFFEFIRGSGRSLLLAPLKAIGIAHGDVKQPIQLQPFHFAVLLAGGTGLIYALLGHEYVMVHIYLYLFLTPAFSLLGARFVERTLNPDFKHEFYSVRDSIWLTGIGLTMVALYPYGIFKTNALQDLFTSIALVLGVLILLAGFLKRCLSAQLIMGLTALALVSNVSQMINYRNEPDTERSFCRAARAEFNRTHQAIRTNEPWSSAKQELYCVDIPFACDAAGDAR